MSTKLKPKPFNFPLAFKYKNSMKIHFFELIRIHRVLGSCEFQWWSFHSCAFSKNSQACAIFRNCFMHAFLVTYDLSAGNLVHSDVCKTKKMCKPRTGFTAYQSKIDDVGRKKWRRLKSQQSITAHRKLGRILNGLNFSLLEYF